MMKKYFNLKYFLSICSVLASALIMAVANNTLIEEANLLPGGFMGFSRLIHLAGSFIGLSIPVNAVLLSLNIPVALLCMRRISKRFVFFSLLQVFSLSFFMNFLPKTPIFNQTILNVVFGGTIWGFGTAIALRGSASTGGTDFIALYVANKTGKEIWTQVFAVNCVQLTVFGLLFGWEKAGYSIIFQFISTRMISVFHNRYKRVMLQIFTKKPECVVQAYLNHLPHGITIFDGTGGYTGERTCMLMAITSSYEVNEAIEIIQKADPRSIINVTKSERLVGNFRQPTL